jgi:glycosyltransferase involved in cell wall biosynthesis
VKVLVVSAEAVGAMMAGPAIRAAELARAIAVRCDVTLAAPEPSSAPGLSVLEAGMADVEALVAAAREHDVVVAQELPPTVLERIAGGPRLVIDLYNPVVVEVLEAVADRPPAAQRRIRSMIVARTVAQLAAADLVLCANERQRDLWTGAMATHGLLDPGDAPVMVVPFGLPDEAPASTGALRAAFPSIGPGDRVLVWGGGLWTWLDPITPMRAVAQLDGVHLVIMGAGRPGLDATGQSPAVERALAAAESHERVHVNRDWVPYAERGGWLAGADLGVSAHHDHLEARYAHRTRILDYVWAGLPVVATRGDALADTVEREGLGRTVAPGDIDGYAAACEALLGAAGATARERIAAVAPELRWSAVAEPLVQWCATEQPRRRVRRSALRRATLSHYRWALPQTVAERGAMAAARRVARRLRRVGTLR